MTLYELVNNITKDGYVGITHRDPKKRWQEHIYDLRSNSHKNLRLQNAFNKYGEMAFQFVVREKFDSLEELNKREKEILEQEKDRLYNLAPGGNAFFHYIETKKQISQKQLKPVVGMNVKTSEIREYPSVTWTAKDGFNPKNIGSACRLYRCELSNRSYRKLSVQGWVWMYKKDFTVEEMEKRRAMAFRGKIRLERPVIGKSLKTGEIVTFRSGEEGRRTLRISGIYQGCRYGTCKSRGGYVWVYGDIDNPQSLLERRYLEQRSVKYKSERIKKPLKVPIVAMSLLSNDIKEYDMVQDVKNDGFSPAYVYRLINNKVPANHNGMVYKNLSHKNWIFIRKENFCLEEFKLFADKIKRNIHRGYK